MKILYYRHNNKEAMPTMQPHRISCQELTVILSGNTQYTVNGVTYPLTAGDVIYVPHTAMRSRPAVENTDYVSFNFLTDETLEFPISMEGGCSETVKSLIEAFDSIFKYTNNLKDERFVTLFHCLLLQIKKQLALQTENPLVAKIKRYIKDHLSEKMTLTDITTQAYLSPIYCENIFKKHTGKSVIDYLIDERIEKAKTMLWESGFPLKKISLSVGFQDYNYFCRTFRKRTGYTPLQYRKKIQNLDVSYTDD